MWELMFRFSWFIFLNQDNFKIIGINKEFNFDKNGFCFFQVNILFLFLV